MVHLLNYLLVPLPVNLIIFRRLLSAGTAFVKFSKKKDADKCVEKANDDSKVE